jgi:hypothetical protein
MLLLIRQEQIAALQLDTDMRWYDRQLADLYPGFAAAPAAQRLQWIRGGIDRAHAARLGRSEVFQFLCFEQTFHPGCLDEAGFEWARALLAPADSPAAERMKQLRHACIRRLLQLEAQQLAQAATLPADPIDVDDEVAEQADGQGAAP